MNLTQQRKRLQNYKQKGSFQLLQGCFTLEFELIIESLHIFICKYILLI